jgi:hypothetical protein
MQLLNTTEWFHALLLCPILICDHCMFLCRKLLSKHTIDVCRSDNCFIHRSQLLRCNHQRSCDLQERWSLLSIMTCAWHLAVLYNCQYQLFEQDSKIIWLSILSCFEQSNSEIQTLRFFSLSIFLCPCVIHHTSSHIKTVLENLDPRASLVLYSKHMHIHADSNLSINI